MTVPSGVILLPTYLAAAIEWVLRPSRDPSANPLPDLSRLTSEQMQLLPLPVAQDFMALMLAVQARPPARRKPAEAPDPRQRLAAPSVDRPLARDGERDVLSFNEAYSPGEPPNGRGGQWPGRFEAGRRQLARRDRQRAQVLSAAHTRLLAWYVQTASAKHRSFKR